MNDLGSSARRLADSAKSVATLESKTSLRSAPADQEDLMVRFGLLLALLMAPTVAFAECASEDRIALAQMGYTEAQIDAQCNSGQNAFAPPADAAGYCVTQYGYCPLPSSAPAGTSCSCDSQYGPIPGVAQ
jgi:hypothetical protein